MNTKDTFTFNRIDRGTARYESRGRVVDIEVEAGVNGLLIVYLSAAKAWQKPAATLTDAERIAIESDLKSIDMGQFARLDIC